MKFDGIISIWFFIGASLLVNGVLIFGAGFYDLFHPPLIQPHLFQLHSGVWWGAILAIVGAAYSIYYFPGKRST